MKPSEWIESLAKEIIKRAKVETPNGYEIIQEAILDALVDGEFRLVRRDKQ